MIYWSLTQIRFQAVNNDNADSEFSSVIFDPALLAKLDSEEIGEINERAFDSMSPGQNTLVVDEETIESGALFEKIVKSALIEAVKRK